MPKASHLAYAHARTHTHPTPQAPTPSTPSPPRCCACLSSSWPRRSRATTAACPPSCRCAPCPGHCCRPQAIHAPAGNRSVQRVAAACLSVGCSALPGSQPPCHAPVQELVKTYSYRTYHWGDFFEVAYKVGSKCGGRDQGAWSWIVWERSTEAVGGASQASKQLLRWVAGCQLCALQTVRAVAVEGPHSWLVPLCAACGARSRDRQCTWLVPSCAAAARPPPSPKRGKTRLLLLWPRAGAGRDAAQRQHPRRLAGPAGPSSHRGDVERRRECRPALGGAPRLPACSDGPARRQPT